MITIITIHRHGDSGLEETIDSVIPALKCKDIAGYLIYESGGRTIYDDRLDRERVKYLYDQPIKGISNALNSAVEKSVSIFKTANYHTFIHSGDILNVRGEKLIDICREASDKKIDLIFGVRALEKNGKIIYSIPDFNRIKRGMTVGHIGTLISNDIHNIVGGYSEEYKLAMDYEFMLRAYKMNAKYENVNGCIGVMNEEGVSAKNAFKALREVKKIRWNNKVSTRWKIEAQFNIDCMKRYVYEKLEMYPNILSRLILCLNRSIIKE